MIRVEEEAVLLDPQVFFYLKPSNQMSDDTTQNNSPDLDPHDLDESSLETVSGGTIIGTVVLGPLVGAIGELTDPPIPDSE